MRLVSWSFRNILMPMIEDENGTLLCTSNTLCKALNITPSALSTISNRYKNELSGIRVTDCDPVEFFQEHKHLLDMKQVRGDMRLWTEDDMLCIAFVSQSDVSREFRTHMKNIAKEQARRGYISKDEYDRAVTELEGRLTKLEEIVKEQASLSGQFLANHRHANKMIN